LLGLAVAPVWAHGPSADLDFYLAVDVPTDVPLPAGSTTVLPWNLARHRQPLPEYTLDLSPAQPLALPLPALIDACHLLTTGDWLFSVEAPMDDPAGTGVTFRPGDVVLYDHAAGLYVKIFDGVGFGLAAGVDVDAAFIRDQTGIDGSAPTGPNPQDWMVVARYFDSVAAGIPRAVNMTAADERGGVGTGGPHRAVLSFDVPTDDPTAGATFLPGDLVGWDTVNSAFDPQPLHRDPNWPILAGGPAGYSSRVNALCFLASPGRIPCVPPNKLHIDKGPGSGQITLTWAASCSIGAEDYGIHEGTLGSWYSHDEIDCYDDGGDFSEVVNYAAGDTYYLVVPYNANDEGSYGKRSVPPLAAPAERPASGPTPNCEDNDTGMRELSCP
jgi:hypothetical protein